eukprot:PhF_6_TR19988/c0_g1_i2/m.29164
MLSSEEDVDGLDAISKQYRECVSLVLTSSVLVSPRSPLVSSDPQTYKLYSLYECLKPSLSIDDYLARFQRYGKSSPQVYVLLVILLDRWVEHTGQNISRTNVFRLVLAAYVVAIKMHDDVFYSDRFYSKIGGVQPRDLVQLEASFLRDIRFNLWVPEETFFAYENAIVARTCTLHSSDHKNDDCIVRIPMSPPVSGSVTPIEPSTPVLVTILPSPPQSVSPQSNNRHSLGHATESSPNSYSSSTSFNSNKDRRGRVFASTASISIVAPPSHQQQPGAPGGIVGSNKFPSVPTTPVTVNNSTTQLHTSASSPSFVRCPPISSQQTTATPQHSRQQMGSRNSSNTNLTINSSNAMVPCPPPRAKGYK